MKILDRLPGQGIRLQDLLQIWLPDHRHLLNSSRLSMLPHAMKFRDMGISSLRLDGRYMDEGQLRKTVRNYRKYMAYPAELTEAEKKAVQQLEGENITRGHYFRGVL